MSTFVVVLIVVAVVAMAGYSAADALRSARDHRAMVERASAPLPLVEAS